MPKTSEGYTVSVETKFKHYILRTVCHSLTYPEVSSPFLAASKSFLFQINLYSLLIRVNFCSYLYLLLGFSYVMVSAADTKLFCFMNRGFFF